MVLCLVTVKLWIILFPRKLFNIERFETLGKEWFEVCHLQDHSNPKFRYILVGFLEFLVILTIKTENFVKYLIPFKILVQLYVILKTGAAFLSFIAAQISVY